MTEPRTALAVVRIYHDEIFSLVTNEDETPVTRTETRIVQNEDGEPVETEVEVLDKVTVAGEQYDSLGEYRVTGKDGEQETRAKIQQTVPGGYTEVEVSPDVVGTPTEFTHMAEFLLDRHAPGEHVTGLYCLTGDKKVAKRLAAVMGVDYLTTEPVTEAQA